jgi:hypothetical protein
MSDPLLEEANRAAHRITAHARRLCGWLDVHEEIRMPDGAEVVHRELHEAIQAYEDIERRQQKEATA